MDTIYVNINPADSLVRHDKKPAPPQSSSGAREWVSLMLGGLPMVIGMSTLLAVCGFLVYHVAVFQDEIWDYPESIAMVKGISWVPYYEMKIGHVIVPLVTGPYQGGYKTYLAGPVLALLGTSVGVLRGINVFLGFFYLLALAWALAEVVNPRAAMLIFLLPLLDPSFTFFSITDQGQFIVITVTCALALGAFFRAWRRQNWGYITLALAMCSAGITDKLTVIPFVVTMPLLMGLYLWRGWRQWLRPLRLLVYAAVCVLPTVPNMIYFYHEGFGSMNANIHVDPALVPPYFTGMINNIGSFFYCMNGSYLFSMTNTNGVATSSWFAHAGLALLALAPLLAFARHKKGDPLWALPLFCPALMLLCLLVQTKVAGLSRPWHILMIYHATFAAGVFLIIHDLTGVVRQWCGRGAAILAAGAFMLVLIGQAQWGVCRPLVNTIRINGGTESRAMNVYTLHENLEELLSKAKNRAKIQTISVSYSLTSQIFVLSYGQIKPWDWEFKKYADKDIADVKRGLDGGNQWIIYRYCYMPYVLKSDSLTNRGWNWLKAKGFFDDPNYEMIRFDDPKAMTEVGILRKKPVAAPAPAKPVLPAATAAAQPAAPAGGGR